MKMSLKLGLLLLAAAVFFSCSKKDADTIVIATDATWPPMEYIDDSGKLVGLDIDLMTKAAELAGFKVEFKNTAWDGIFIGLANKQYDAVMSSVTITEERKAEMDFSTPYINAGQILVVRKNQTGVTTLADLAGKKAGAQINTTGAMEIQKTGNVELKAYDELGFAIEDLKNGKIDGVVADAPTAADFVLSNADNSAKLMIVGEPFTEEYYGVAVRKGNTKVLEIINSGIEALVESGADKEIIAKWLR